MAINYTVQAEVVDISADTPKDESRIEDGKLYMITITDKHVDWESGLLDDWTWGAVEIKEGE